MKKMFVSLVLTLMFFLPFTVNALKVAPKITEEPINEETVGDKLKRTYNIYRIVTESSDNETEEDTKVTEAVFNFTFGTAIEEGVCTAGTGFTVSQDSTTNSKATCTFTASDENGVTGTEILLGTITITIDKNTTDDCTIYYSYGGETAKIVPNTGADLPYAIIAGGVLLVGAVYVVTRKQTKLQKI